MKKIIKSMNLPRPLGTPSLREIVLLLIALAFAACTADEPLSDNNPTNPLAGTLHIGTITVDGVTTARATIEGSDTEHGNNKIPSNRTITAFSNGDELTISYSFGGNNYSTAYTTFNGNAWSELTDEYNTLLFKPDAANESWADARIDEISFHTNCTDADEAAEIESDGFLASALENAGKGDIYITRMTDNLIATTADITLDNKPGSNTLGSITAKLTHRDALLRLPASGITIENYGDEFSHLQELLAKVDGTYYRFTPVTIGNTVYWQAIVLGSSANSTENLTEFIAILGPADSGTPGANTFKTGKDGDNNIIATASGTEIPMKPITIPLASGIEMVRNTRYPLTLTLSPHTATVKVGSSVPGWGTEEETIEYAGDINLVGETYEVGDAKGLLTFAEIVKTTRNANCKLVANIDLKNEPWTPIGTDSDNPYTGTFDGGGFTVSNLKVDGGSNNNQGLFGAIDGATVKNLTVANGTVTGSDFIGAIAGFATNSIITNCHNVNVTVTATYQLGYAGGIVGSNYAGNGNATLNACTNTGNVTAHGYAGGIVGVNHADNGNTATLNACTNTGNVTAHSPAGGIVGVNHADNGNTATLNACYWLEGTATNGIGSGSGDATKINKTADATTLANIASALTATATGYTFTVVPTSTPADGFQPGTVLFTVTETATP